MCEDIRGQTVSRLSNTANRSKRKVTENISQNNDPSIFQNGKCFLSCICLNKLEKYLTLFNDQALCEEYLESFITRGKNVSIFFFIQISPTVSIKLLISRSQSQWSYQYQRVSLSLTCNVICITIRFNFMPTNKQAHKLCAHKEECKCRTMWPNKLNHGEQNGLKGARLLAALPKFGFFINFHWKVNFVVPSHLSRQSIIRSPVSKVTVSL